MTLDDLRDRVTITVPEAAAAVGISRSSAYEAAKRGQLPTIRLGRRLRVSVPALLSMLGADGQITNGTTPPGKSGADTYITTIENNDHDHT